MLARSECVKFIFQCIQSEHYTFSKIHKDRLLIVPEVLSQMGCEVAQSWRVHVSMVSDLEIDGLH